MFTNLSLQTNLIIVKNSLIKTVLSCLEFNVIQMLSALNNRIFLIPLTIPNTFIFCLPCLIIHFGKKFVAYNSLYAKLSALYNKKDF